MTKINATGLPDLDKLGRGDLDPVSARLVIRSALKSDQPAESRVYAAMRDMVWRILATRDFGLDLGQWHEVIAHTATLTRKKGSGAIAERLSALAELVSQSARFAEAQAPSDVLGRKHVQELLALLAAKRGDVARTTIKQELRVADANLSRILTLLSVNGLVHRVRTGKEASFRLTEAGRSAITVGGDENLSKPPLLSIEAIPFPLAAWNADGECIGMNAPFRRAAQKIGCEKAIGARHSEWSDAIDSATIERRALEGHGGYEINLAGDNWLHCRQSSWQNCNMLAMLDISHERREQDRLVLYTRDLHAKVSKLESELAEFRHRAVAYGTAFKRIRESVVDAAVGASRRLQDYIENSPGHAFAPKEELSPLRDYLRAVTSTAGELLILPDPLITSQKEASFVDLKEEIEQTIENFRTLHASRFDVKIGRMQPVMVHAPVGVALTHLLYAVVPRHFHQGSLALSAMIKGEQLVLSLESDGRASVGEKGAHTIFAASQVTEDTIDNWNVFAKDFGCVLEVETPDHRGVTAAKLHVPVVRAPSPRSRRTIP